MLVLARAASGKSVVLAQLGVAVAGALSDGEDSAEQRVLPLKIPLVTLASMMRQTTGEGATAAGVCLLRRYLSEHEKLAPPRVECLARSLSHGAMLLLLDGLDEATTQVESVLQWVDEMSAAHPRLRVVLSSRPVSGVDPSAMGARGFRILHVQPLASSQVCVCVCVCVTSLCVVLSLAREARLFLSRILLPLLNECTDARRGREARRRRCHRRSHHDADR